MEEMQTDNENGVELTDAENELYDRQIRLWGMESQKRLRTAKVVICGLTGLGAEVTKNIILSGVNSVVLQDDNIVTEEDFCSQFLVERKSLGLNRAEASIGRARALNPMVEISADTKPLSEKDAEFFKQFNVVFVNGIKDSEILRIDEICRENNVMFFAGDVWGTFGYYFADLQDHSFVEDVVKHKIISKPSEKIKTEIITSTVHRELKFPPYMEVLKFDINSDAYQRKLKRTGPAFVIYRILMQFRDVFNRNPCYKTRDADIAQLVAIRNETISDSIVPSERFQSVFSQVSPSAAIVGGVLAQEIIKGVSKKEAPHCNVFLFEPENCCGFVETIGVS